jgi:hypothetical protein
MARGRSTTKLGRTAVKVARDGGKKVVLLSGGNPQIPKGDGGQPVRAYLDAMPGWKRSIGEGLDALIVRTVPGGGQRGAVEFAVLWGRGKGMVSQRPLLEQIREGDVFCRHGVATDTVRSDTEEQGGAVD